MRCLKHKAEAVALCPHCGRALCPDCIQSSSAPRMSCSAYCAGALLRNDQALRAILEQVAQSAKASAFYCYVCGGLSAAAGVVAWFMLPSPFLILFTGGCGLVLTASGVWYGRISRKQPRHELTPTRSASVTEVQSGKAELDGAGENSPNTNLPMEMESRP